MPKKKTSNRQRQPRHKTQKTSNSDLIVSPQYQQLMSLNLSEKERNAKRLENFDLAGSKPYEKITNMFGLIDKPKLINIGFFVGSSLNVLYDRDAQRHKNVTYKWLEENWDLINESHILDQIRFNGDQVIRIEASENKTDIDARLNHDAGTQMKKTEVDFYDFLNIESGRNQESSFDKSFFDGDANDNFDFY